MTGGFEAIINLRHFMRRRRNKKRRGRKLRKREMKIIIKQGEEGSLGRRERSFFSVHFLPSKKE